MADLRAILVGDEQREALDEAIGDAYGFGQDHNVYPVDDEATAKQVAKLEVLTQAFDAAGDQPRIRWCAEHGSPIAQLRHPDMLLHLNGDVEYSAKHCRVVDAIVCVLPEQP